MMIIASLLPNPAAALNKSLHSKWLKFQSLINELNDRQLPEGTITAINSWVCEINDFTGSCLSYFRLLGKNLWEIVKSLEKELKIVPKNYYRNLWLILGMTSLGVPFGLMFCIVFQNMDLLGIGFPIGIAIGIALGSSMDDKAKSQGNQLYFEMFEK